MTPEEINPFNKEAEPLDQSSLVSAPQPSSTRMGFPESWWTTEYLAVVPLYVLAPVPAGM